MSTASSSPILDMKVSDLVELLDSDVTGSPSTSRDESRDVEVLYGRNETTGQQGSFTASCVYILPTMEKPTTDFVVSTQLYTLCHYTVRFTQVTQLSHRDRATLRVIIFCKVTQGHSN